MVASVSNIAIAQSCTAPLPVQPTGQKTTTNYAYDAQGNRTTITDACGFVTSQAFDNLNRMSTVTQPIPSGSSSHPVITTGYDERDQVVSVTDPLNHATNYTVDGLGNLNTQVSPDTGATANTYDAYGNLKTSTDARSDVSSYTYDSLNRVKSITYTSGTATNFTYDGGSSPVQYDIGHLTGIADESGSTRLYYDGFGRVLKKTQITGSGSTLRTQTLTYTYSETGSTTGKLTSVTYPSGDQVNYTYDAAGRIAGITLTMPTTGGGVGNTTLVSSVTYNPFGAPTGWTWGNGATYARTYDLDGRLNQYPLGVTSGTVTTNGLTRSVTYDTGSRITNFTHTDTSGSGTSPVAQAANQLLGFDALNRTTSYEQGPTSAPTATAGYSYDLNGNRTGFSVNSNNYTNTITSTNNQLASTTGPSPAKTNTYDAAGNLLNDGTGTGHLAYLYSARGRMQSSTEASTTTTYTYNGLGQRVYKGFSATSANRYVYDEAGHMLGEYDTSGQAIQETVYLGDTPIGVITPFGTGVVMDNVSFGTSFTGTWSSSVSLVNFFGQNYQAHSASSGTDTFTWPLAIPTAGTYDVYAWWPAASTNATSAPYTIHYSGGSATVNANQQANGGKWVLLGTYAFTATTYNVVLGTSPTGVVVADAVKATLSSADGMTADYVFPDQVDAPRMITRPVDNQMVWRWDEVDPFGITAPTTNPSGLGTYTYNPRFPGQMADVESGLNYNYFRNYDPTLGRYVQSDPIGVAGGVDTYLYVGANPLGRSDPRGLDNPGMGPYGGGGGAQVNLPQPPGAGPSVIWLNLGPQYSPRGIPPGKFPWESLGDAIGPLDQIPKNVCRAITGLLPPQPPEFDVKANDGSQSPGRRD